MQSRVAASGATSDESARQPHKLLTEGGQIEVERLLDLEDKEHASCDELKEYKARVGKLNEQMKLLTQELELEMETAAALQSRRHQEEAERKRPWDTMSKEDIRELGRRDIERKRHEIE